MTHQVTRLLQLIFAVFIMASVSSCSKSQENEENQGNFKIDGVNVVGTWMKTDKSSYIEISPNGNITIGVPSSNNTKFENGYLYVSPYSLVKQNSILDNNIFLVSAGGTTTKGFITMSGEDNMTIRWYASDSNDLLTTENYKRINGVKDLSEISENIGTVCFFYQYPMITIILGDGGSTRYHAHQFELGAGVKDVYSYEGYGIVTVAVDNSLCNNLYFEDRVTPVKAMPSNYYELPTNTLVFDGTPTGSTYVQLTDAFFEDPDAVKNTYVIPFVMTSQTGFEKILTGTLKEGQSGSRTNASVWKVQPKDFVLYCIKYENKYSGLWKTYHTTSTEGLDHRGEEVTIVSKSLNSCIYTVSYKEGNQLYTADLLLEFDNKEFCSISSLTNGVFAKGNGLWSDNSEKVRNRDLDGMELNYIVTFGNGKTFSVHEKLVRFDSGGGSSLNYSPVYIAP